MTETDNHRSPSPLITARDALERALPRSQSGEVVDAIIRDLRDLGFVIVPKEPTEAMHRAGEVCCMDQCTDREGINKVYRAMIASGGAASQ